VVHQIPNTNRSQIERQQEAIRWTQKVSCEILLGRYFQEWSSQIGKSTVLSPLQCTTQIKRMEYTQELKQIWKEKQRVSEKPKVQSNHKKWHRNHPADGFYTKREQFLD